MGDDGARSIGAELLRVIGGVGSVYDAQAVLAVVLSSADFRGRADMLSKLHGPESSDEIRSDWCGAMLRVLLRNMEAPTALDATASEVVATPRLWLEAAGPLVHHTWERHIGPGEGLDHPPRLSVGLAVVVQALEELWAIRDVFCARAET